MEELQESRATFLSHPPDLTSVNGKGSCTKNRWFSILWCLFACLGIVPYNLFAAEQPTISAKDAASILQTTRSLSHVTISDPFDLTQINVRHEDVTGPLPTMTFTNVRFEGGIIATNPTVHAHLHFQTCITKSIEVPNTIWSGKVLWKNSTVEQTSNFKHNTFKKPSQFNFSKFHGETWFHHSVFEAPVQFLSSTWIQGGYFSNATFTRPTLFNKSESHGPMVFLATIFEEDVGFIDFTVTGPEEEPAPVTFFNTLFKGDAEFRYCRFDHARFSSRKKITVFSKLADFRGCEMGKANFDFLEAQGPMIFLKTHFGPGGVSFNNAVFYGDITNWENIQSTGPMDLTDAYLPTLRFRWTDIDEAVLSTHPPSYLLNELWKRAKELDHTQDALALQYEISRQTMKEVWENPAKSLFDKMWTGFQWITWGWSTGYGTKFGRIVFLTGLCWLMCSIPGMMQRGLFIEIPIPRNQEKLASNKPRYSPILWTALPIGCWSPLSQGLRWRLAMAYTFSLMFKVGFRNVVYVEPIYRTARYGYERYFMVVWGIGSVLLAFMAITLSNTSPVFRMIIGEMIF